MRLLVVDDDPVFREELAALLTEEGNYARFASSVRKAIELMQEEEPDVVFTDLRMPRESGLELLREVRTRWPHVAVVVVTGYASVPTAVEAMKLGAFDYLAKPFRAQHVRQILHNVVEQQRFFDAYLPTGRAEEIAGRLATREGAPILLAQSDPAPLAPGVELFRFDGSDPSELDRALDGFLESHPRGGLVIADAGRMLEGRRLEDILGVLNRWRDRLRGRPFAVGIDPNRLSEPQANAIRTVVAVGVVQSALEAVASPIRRRTLYRLAQGPATFSDAMRAAELEDSPKMSFHLNRLVSEGLTDHRAEQYRITEKGQQAVDLLRKMESIAARGEAPNLLFQTARPAPRGETDDAGGPSLAASG